MRYKSVYNETYHLINKGVNNMVVFRNDEDKAYFYRLISEYSVKFDINVYAYALMDNHYHLCVSAKNKDFTDISKFMRGVNLRYVKYFNRTDVTDKEDIKRTGTIFQSTYKSIPVNSLYQLKSLIRYIHNNPEAMNVNIEEYPWSSYHRYLDVIIRKIPKEIDDKKGIPLDMSKFNDLSEEQFIDFMMEGKNDIFYECGKLYQGKHFLSDPILYGEIEATLGIKVSTIKYMDYKEQSEALYRISLIQGATKKQIARITGMNYSQMCRTIKDFFKKCVLTELGKQKDISNMPVEQITAITKLVLEVLKNNKLMV